MDHINWQRRRDILICVICVGVILGVAWLIVNQFIEAILLLLLSMAVSFLISPVVDFLEKYKVPRVLGSLVSYAIVIAALAGFFYALIFTTVQQGVSFSETIVSFANSIPDKYASLITFLHNQGIPQANIDDAVTQIERQAQDFATTAVQNAYNALLFLSNALLDIILVTVLSFYLTLDGKRIRESMFSIVPQRTRPHVLLFEDALNRVVGNYIRGQLILAIIIGVAVSLVCVFTGLGQFALIFGMLGFLFETIPMVGPGLASISPIIASLLLPGAFPRTIIIIVCFIVIQALESNVLGPRIVGHAVGLHPVASIMALLIFAKLFGDTYGAFGGAVGALVATPLVAAAWVVIASFYRSFRGETADQILARKRAPWQLRRPTIPTTLRIRRLRQHPGSHSTPSTEPATAHSEGQSTATQTQDESKQNGHVLVDSEEEASQRE
ncbi:MAG: AI-2E family transporter [Ktedonobacteraceae bacterium]|nr:AI-2E family transporter [Ktedonobacteraceae bacterium]MBO0791125.1 AI-2E family transporter [Ktedonobacteraceae bacterium]